MRLRFTQLAQAIAIVCFAASANADETADLRAQIDAQRAAQSAQAAKLQELEQKLSAIQPAQPAAPAGPSLSYTQGSGLNLNTPLANVTLYGLIDVTYVHQTNANSAGQSLNTPNVAWFSGDRWGLLGRRPLGTTGLDVIFRLESEFDNQTGDMDTPGVIFNRDAWAGVESKEFGKLTFGRQNALGRDFAGIFGDPYSGPAPSTDECCWANNNNFKQLVRYGAAATGTRVDNGVTWKKKFDSGLVAGLQYQFGGVAGKFSEGSSETVALGYAGTELNLAGHATSANVAGNTDTSFSFGGNYPIGPVRLFAGYFYYRGEQGALGDRRDDAYTVSGKYAPGGSFDYELGYQVMRTKNGAVDGDGNAFLPFDDSSGTDATRSGSRSTAYGSVFYHFDKVNDVYAAWDYTKVNGNYMYAPLNGFKSQTELALGFRTRF